MVQKPGAQLVTHRGEGVKKKQEEETARELFSKMGLSYWRCNKGTAGRGSMPLSGGHHSDESEDCKL